MEKDPALVRQGRDPQLERAVEAVMEGSKKSPPPLGRPVPATENAQADFILVSSQRGHALPGWRVILPCLLLFVILLFPRVVLALMWFFSRYLDRAFHGGLLLPLLGFFFLPLTTIVYAWELNNGMPTEGINLLWLLIAVLIDLGGVGGGARHRSRR